MIAIYRPFDLRLMINSGLIRRLGEGSRIVLLLPPELKDMERPDVPDLVIETLSYENKYTRSNRPSMSFGPVIDRTVIQRILYYAYGQRDGHANRTRALLLPMIRETHVPGFQGLLNRFVLAMSTLACRSRALRRALQAAGRLCNSPRTHAALFETYRPAMLVVGSMGLSLDALIMREARRYGLPVVSIVQSWDKTSSKGYPLTQPDHAIVWSDVMAWETEVFLDMDPARVFVGGVPQWDHYFRDIPLPDVRTLLGLRPDKKTIYVALCATSYHDGNLALVGYLVDCLRAGRFAVPVQILFRPHPAYYGALGAVLTDDKKELLDLLESLRGEPDVHVSIPRFVEKPFPFFPADDAALLKAVIAAADVTVSVLSTQMIESCIMDKPTITLNYGRWNGPEIVTELQDYIAEHLERVFEAGAILRSTSPDELLRDINDSLSDPARLAPQRQQLIDREIPRHRGAAATVIADHILELLAGCVTARP